MSELLEKAVDLPGRLFSPKSDKGILISVARFASEETGNAGTVDIEEIADMTGYKPQTVRYGLVNLCQNEWVLLYPDDVAGDRTFVVTLNMEKIDQELDKLYPVGQPMEGMH